ncbi:hypothetical protein QE38_10515 [Salmonella enterica]|nr:hypothetical protein [Salmonella enterica]
MLSVSALLNKSNFQEMDGSDHCHRFRIGFLWQSKILKSPTGQQRGSLTVWLDEFCYCNMEQQRTPPEGRG